MKFVIAADDTVQDPEIVKSVSESLDAEALRVVGLLPAWTPARNGGKAVATSYTIPINFSLKADKTEK